MTDAGRNRCRQALARSNADPVLRVSRLSIDHFGAGNSKQRVVHDAEFEVGKATVVGLCGDSGCGKTTLALALLRLLSPARYNVTGSVCIHNRELLSLSERELERVRGAEIAMVLQDPMLALNPVMRTCDQVTEVIRAHKRHKTLSDTAESLFGLVGLADSRRILRSYPHQLSGGERQRVAIAQALAARPSLVIADEPFTALDAPQVNDLCVLFRNLKEQAGISFLVISHSPGVLAAIADRVMIMYAGRIVEIGSPEELFRNPLHPFTNGLMRSIPKADSRRLFSIPGNPANPAVFWPGCPFEPRCSERMEICKSQPPPRFELGPQRWVRCFRHAR